MTQIKYVKGDATAPVGEGSKIIVHICNDLGGWGKGFVLALSKRWKQPEKKYREWYKSGKDFELGAMQLVQAETYIWVAHMIGQEGMYSNKFGVPPIRYEATAAALEKVCDDAIRLNATVHMPRIGCGLAGGSWDKIEPIVLEKLSTKGIEVTVYDF